MQLINMTNYDDRINKNGNAYLVVKDTANDSYMVRDVRLFNTIKNSLVINAEVQVETGSTGSIFRNILTAETVTPGQLPKAEKKWTGGGGGYGKGGGGQGDGPRIVRQNVLNRGVDICIALLNKDKLTMDDGESVAHAIARQSIALGEVFEKWVQKAGSAPEAVAPAPQPAPPVPPVTTVAPSSDPFAGLDDDVPF